MATTNTLNDLIAARDIALIRGDISAVNALNKTINELDPFGDGTGGGMPVGPSSGGSTFTEVPQTNVSTGPSTIIDRNDFITVRPEDRSVGGTQSQDARLVDRAILSDNRLVVGGSTSPTSMPDCDYRYSFGCPVFSRYISDAGCRILIPIYRTCYPIGINANPSITPTSELIGNMEITAYGIAINDTQQNYISPSGVKGTRVLNGTRLTAEGIYNAIVDLAGVKTLTNWVPSADGIYRNTTGLLQIETIIANLLDLATSTSGIQPKGTLQQWAEYLAQNCDLSTQPSYCISSETFIPDTDDGGNNGGGSGKFCNTGAGKVAIPNTKQLVRTESRPVVGVQTDQYVKVPNKPCTIGLERQMQSIQIYSEQYGYPCYSNSDFSGNIIGYDSTETRETTVFGEISKIYVAERMDPNCSYTEYEKEYEEDDPANPCLGIIKKDVIRRYEDGRQEVYAKGVFVRYFRRMDADCSPETIKVYHPLDLGTDVITGKVKVKTTGLFNYSQSLECYKTSSTQAEATKKYYYAVTDCDSCGRTPFFSVAYGHMQGSGSLYVEGDVYDTPTKAIHSQYRLLALDSTETQFTFYTNGIATQSKDVYVLNFFRNGLSDRLDPGNFQLSLAQLTGTAYANNVFTGSNVQVSSSNYIVHLIDSSLDTNESTTCAHDPYVSYDIVSGSLTTGVYSTANRHTYGTVYPNLGIIVLDPSKLNSTLSFNTVTGSNIAGDNAMKLFTSISGSSALGSHLKARNVKYKTTNHYFVRVGAPYANYSNNPTYVSGSDGYLFHPCFENGPQTYITTIGLYNDFNELLAVAKLSQPINKSFDNDVLIKIRLNW